MNTYKYICKYTYNSKTLPLSSINRKGRLNSPLSKHMDNVSYPERQPLDLDLLLFFLVKPESATKCRIRRHGRIRRRLTRNGFFFLLSKEPETRKQVMSRRETLLLVPESLSVSHSSGQGNVVLWCVLVNKTNNKWVADSNASDSSSQNNVKGEKKKKPGSYFVSRPTFFLFCFCDFPPCPSSVGTQNNFGWRPGQNKNKNKNKKNWLELDDENIPETILYLSV